MLNQNSNHKDANVNPVDTLTVCIPQEPAFTEDFLSVIKATGFETLQETLQNMGVPKAALDLLEDLTILATAGNVRDGDQVSSVVNQMLTETVASASRNISKLGGIFYGPTGNTIGRKVG